MFYMQVRRQELKESNPGLQVTDISKMISQEWSALDEYKKKQFAIDPDIQQEMRANGSFKDI